MADPRDPGTNNNRGGGSPGPIQRRTCPLCGESFGQLPLHMRACDGGNDG